MGETFVSLLGMQGFVALLGCESLNFSFCLERVVPFLTDFT